MKKKTSMKIIVKPGVDSGVVKVVVVAVVVVVEWKTGVTFTSTTSERPITHISCQIVDTPGILDRTLKERNEIELRAIAALKNLATAIVFIFDFTQETSLITQINLFNQISQNFTKVPLLLICGKEDLLSENQKSQLQVFWEQNFPQSLMLHPI